MSQLENKALEISNEEEPAYHQIIRFKEAGSGELATTFGAGNREAPPSLRGRWEDGKSDWTAVAFIVKRHGLWKQRQRTVMQEFVGNFKVRSRRKQSRPPEQVRGPVGW
jgi:hypothetical protein